MEFEPNYETVKANAPYALEDRAVKVDTRLLPNSGSGISKVLSIIATPSVRVSEVFTGEARVSGEVDFTVIYLSAERVESTHATVAFTEKLVSDKIAEGATIAATATTVETTVQAVSEQEIRLVSEIKISAVTDAASEYSVLTNAVGAVTNTTQFDYTSLRYRANETGNLVSDAISDKMLTVLSCRHVAWIDTVTPLIGTVRVSGVVATDVIGLAEDGVIIEQTVETQFTRELTADGVGEDDIALCYVNCVGNLTDERTLEYQLAFTVFCYAQCTSTVVTDLFSPTHELLITMQSQQTSVLLPVIKALDRVDGNVVLDGNLPPVDNILALSGCHLNVINVLALAGEVLVEGTLSGNVIYYSSEAGSENSVAIELPFSTKLTAADVKIGDQVTVCAVLTGCNLKLRRGNELEVKGLVQFTATAVDNATQAFITSAAVGEEKQPCEHAFTVYIAKKGQTPWDIAKQSGVTPDELARQNGELNNVFDGGERVIIYKPNC